MKKLFAALALAAAALTSGLAAAQSSPSDYTSASRYDVMGRVVGTIAPDPDGSGSLKYAATRTTYDTRGNVEKVETGELSSWKTENQDPHTQWGSDFTVHTVAETTYDAMNRKLTDKVSGVTSGTATAISLTQYSYDSAGRLECTALRMNPAAYGSLPASACSLGTEGSNGPDRITRTYYDAAGQVLQIRKAHGTSVEIADVTYSYTDNGQIEELVDANGNKAKLEFDGHDRQNKWIFPSKTQPTGFNDSTPALALSTAGSTNSGDYEAYTYDDNGNRLSLRKRDGSIITYLYDDLNRMTRKTIPNRGNLPSVHERNVHYTYELNGLQTSARFGSLTGQGILNAYDGFGRMVSETNTTDGYNLAITSQYDANGNRTRVTHHDGTYFSYEYDGLNRLSAIKDQSGNTLVTPSFNDRGLLTSAARPGSVQDSTFTYDNANRISGIGIANGSSAADVSWTFTRNAASQILSETQSNDSYSWDGHVNSTLSYTVNGLNQYTGAGSDVFCYDDNGNLTADGDATAGFVYLYDIENRLVQMRQRGSGNTNCSSLSYAGALVAELRYDPMGRLYRLRDYTGGTGIKRFVHDGNALTMEYNSNATVIEQRYVHGSNVDADDALVWYPGSSVALSNARHLFADPRGSIVLVADDSGGTVAINTYDEYGIPHDGSGFDISTHGRFRYTGQAWLPELGMYYYKARIYSPTLGRFMQTDPIGYEDQFNLYAYVGNDPINGIDPTGLYTCSSEKACDVAKTAVAEMQAAKKFYESKPTGSRIARNPQMAKAIGESLDALGEEGVDNGVTIDVGDLPNGELGRHVTDAWGPSTIILDVKQIESSGWSFGSILGHEASHRHSKTQGWDTGLNWRIYSEIRGYAVQAMIQMYTNPRMAIGEIGSTRESAGHWLRRGANASACGKLGRFQSTCTGRVDDIMKQMGF